jgi:parallel beta-helix repeat protein
MLRQALALMMILCSLLALSSVRPVRSMPTMLWVTVTDAVTHVGIGGALVIVDARDSQITDSSGMAEFIEASGPHQVLAEATGYVTQSTAATVPSVGHVSVTFNMTLTQVEILANGSVIPPTAPVSTTDDINYVLTNNVITTANGIIVERSNIVIDGNGETLQGNNSGEGLNMTNVSNVTVKNATVENFFDGVYFFNSNNDAISGCNATANIYYGIYLSQSSSDSVSGNNVTANSEDGVVLDSYSSSDTISGNSIAANDGYGIYLYYSSGNSISGNKITNNTYGFRVDFSSNNTISSNSVASNSYVGIYLVESSNNNFLSGNNITNNTYGINVGSSSGNSIHHNNFINNSAQTFSYNSTNLWDYGYPSGGNYWSDYNGSDLYKGAYQNITGSDGIGDTPYAIDSNNTDRYPLMQPFGQSSTLVVCSPSTAYAGSSVTCTATVLGSGPTGTVNWTTSSSAGSFTQQVCTLSSGSCTTTYTDNYTGYVTITASYSGDSNNVPSSGTATLTVYINVTTGTNVTVNPTNGLTLTFANVTVAGTVVANATQTVQAPALDLVGPYYNVKVTAGFSGNVTVSVAFDGSNMTQQQKANLTMIQYMPIPGDVVAPFGQVDIRDVHYVAVYYGTTQSSPNWNPNADLNGDGKVDIRDVHIAAVNYGKTANWINITTYVDTTNNIIYGSTTHFSFIGIHG